MCIRDRIKAASTWLYAVSTSGYSTATSSKVRSHRSPEKVRIERLIDRGMEIDDIKNRISNQPTDVWWQSIGTVINNDVKEDLEGQLKEVIESLL